MQLVGQFSPLIISQACNCQRGVYSSVFPMIKFYIRMIARLTSGRRRASYLAFDMSERAGDLPRSCIIHSEQTRVAIDAACTIADCDYGRSVWINLHTLCDASSSSFVFLVHLVFGCGESAECGMRLRMAEMVSNERRREREGY